MTLNWYHFSYVLIVNWVYKQGHKKLKAIYLLKTQVRKSKQEVAGGVVNKSIAPMIVFFEKETAHRKQNEATASSKVSNFHQFRAYIYRVYVLELPKADGLLVTINEC